MTDAERYREYISQLLTYENMEVITCNLINQAEQYTGEDDMTYDKLMWLIRSAIIQGAMWDYSGLFLKPMNPDEFIKLFRTKLGN